MPATFTRRLEKALVLGLAASFAASLLVSLALLLPHTRGHGTDYLRNRTLAGMTLPTERVPLSFSALLSGKFQESFAKNYDARFNGRELLIRLFDEYSLRALHTSPAGILVGPHFSLIEEGYAQEYCLERPGAETLRPIAADLRRLQDFCDARGIVFSLVLTPSKAAIYPEELPAGWLRRYRPEPRAYDQFIALLHAQGVRCVDGHRITMALKKTARIPLFPLGGVHWGQEAALATANALLKLLGDEKLGVQPITDDTIQTSNEPTGQDVDMAGLCNLLWPMRYPVAKVTVPPILPPPTHCPNVVCIGGSFIFSLMEAMEATQQFSEFQYYFYYTNTKGCYSDGQLHTLSAPVPTPNFEADIFSADALVLEANEHTMGTGIDHLQRFLHDALAALPDSHATKLPFHRASWLAYRWGDTLSFATGKPPVDRLVINGFTGSNAGGAFTIGPVASLRFSAPPPPGDVVLEVEAEAFLVDTRLPEQRVTVEVNGHLLGEWKWQAGTPPLHAMVIPKAIFDGGDFRLNFHVARPGSPAEFGVSGDATPYGIILSSLRLRSENQ